MCYVFEFIIFLILHKFIIKIANGLDFRCILCSHFINFAHSCLQNDYMCLIYRSCCTCVHIIFSWIYCSVILCIDCFVCQRLHQLLWVLVYALKVRSCNVLVFEIKCNPKRTVCLGLVSLAISVCVCVLFCVCTLY